ncbi:hypothetical protein N9L94_06440 [Robiginitalea sp.]|nr:hypothetical protein [Robiginitalea sp.]
MKKLILFIGLLLTGCSTTYHLSTLNHDPIYDTVLEVPANVQIDTLSSSQLRWKLRTDFRFRYDFAQYALSQPRSFDWNNRLLGNRFNRYSPYWSYSYSWNRDMMWNDWVWGYPFFQSYMWSPFRYDRWGYNYYGWNGYNNWYNGPWHNSGYNVVWNSSRNNNNVAYHTGRRGSNNIINRNTPRVNVKEDKIDLIVSKIRKRVNNNNIRVYNNPNNPNLNNNSKPRVYVRPNNNSNNNSTPRIYTRPPVNNNSSTTRSSINVSRGSSVSRGGNSNRKN